MPRVIVTASRTAIFPLPMLRFAEAWPSTDEEAMKIERSVRGDTKAGAVAQVIELYTNQSEIGRFLSAKRWASFGWLAEDAE